MTNILQKFKTERSKHSFSNFLTTDVEAGALIEHVTQDFMAYDVADKDLGDKYPKDFTIIITQRHEYLFENLGFTMDDVNSVKNIIATDLVQDDYVELAADILLPPLATAFIANVTKTTIEQTVAELPKYFQKSS